MSLNTKARQKLKKALQLVYKDIILVDWMPVEIIQCAAYALLHDGIVAYNDSAARLGSIIHKYIEMDRMPGVKVRAIWGTIRLLSSSEFTPPKEMYNRIKIVKQLLLKAFAE
jgi:hypothetical protein